MPRDSFSLSSESFPVITLNSWVFEELIQQEMRQCRELEHHSYAVGVDSIKPVYCLFTVSHSLIIPLNFSMHLLLT
jgi:hypothetical protein